MTRYLSADVDPEIVADFAAELAEPDESWKSVLKIVGVRVLRAVGGETTLTTPELRAFVWAMEIWVDGLPPKTSPRRRTYEAMLEHVEPFDGYNECVAAFEAEYGSLRSYANTHSRCAQRAEIDPGVF